MLAETIAYRNVYIITGYTDMRKSINGLVATDIDYPVDIVLPEGESICSAVTTGLPRLRKCEAINAYFFVQKGCLLVASA